MGVSSDDQKRISSHKGVSEVSERACEWSEQSEQQSKRSDVEPCGASERCERTNVASDRVAR